MKLRNILAAGLSACLAAGTLTLCAGAQQPQNAPNRRAEQAPPLGAAPPLNRRGMLYQ